MDGTDSYDPEGGSLNYAWSLDGVQIATGPTPDVGPLTVGVHTITLTVTDDQGFSDADTMVLTAENAPPVSDPWVPGLIATLETTELNGTRSSDPEGDALNYVWTIDGVQIGTGPKPIVGPFDAGTYLVTLTVTDVYGLSASNSVEMTVLNRAPFADSGPNQTVNFAETATLDGTASYDPEGGPLSYTWTLDGTQIATGPNPTVGPFAVGNYVIALTVTDDHGASSTAFPMVLTVVNEAPVADAGLNQSVNYSQTVTLNGAGSSDPESHPLTYVWTLDGIQIGTGLNPVVGPFDIGTHTVTLTVTDDHGAAATDSVVITVVNEAPIANAGPDQTVTIAKGGSTSVTLGGTASSDPEDGPLTYQWSLDGATIGTDATTQISFAKGIFTIILTVTDEHGVTALDSVVITVER